MTIEQGTQVDVTPVKGVTKGTEKTLRGEISKPSAVQVQKLVHSHCVLLPPTPSVPDPTVTPDIDG